MLFQSQGLFRADKSNNLKIVDPSLLKCVTKKTFYIRNIELKDLDNIVALGAAGHQQHNWGKDFYLRIFMGSEPYYYKRCLVSYNDNKEELIAMLFAWRENQGTVFIANLAVKEEFRRRGLGTYLFYDLSTSATVDYKAIKLITISAFTDNKIALTMYHKLGFKDTTLRVIDDKIGSQYMAVSAGEFLSNVRNKVQRPLSKTLELVRYSGEVNSSDKHDELLPSTKNLPSKLLLHL